MNIAETFLPQLDAEMAVTRTLLARTPFEKKDWRPHPKSTTLGALATHIATLQRFGKIALTTTTLDAGSFGTPWRRDQPRSCSGSSIRLSPRPVP